MPYIAYRVAGSPYARSRKAGSQSWVQSIVEATGHLPKVTGPCLLRLTFMLGPDKYDDQAPFGPDLDNLAKRFIDVLKHTVLAEAPGSDGCIVGIEAFKLPVDDESQAGVQFELIPLQKLTHSFTKTRSQTP